MTKARVNLLIHPNIAYTKHLAHGHADKLTETLVGFLNFVEKGLARHERTIILIDWGKPPYPMKARIHAGKPKFERPHRHVRVFTGTHKDMRQGDRPLEFKAGPELRTYFDPRYLAPDQIDAELVQRFEQAAVNTSHIRLEDPVLVYRDPYATLFYIIEQEGLDPDKHYLVVAGNSFLECVLGYSCILSKNFGFDVKIDKECTDYRMPQKHVSREMLVSKQAKARDANIKFI